MSERDVEKFGETNLEGFGFDPEESEAMAFISLESKLLEERAVLISAMAHTLEDCRTRIVGYDRDTCALQARIQEMLIRAEKCK